MDECMPPEGEELFTNNCGLPIQFSMPICPQKEEYRRKIEGHGGRLTSVTGGHHTIRLIPPELKKTSNAFDVFSTKYVDDCINGEKLLSLESYRIGKSLYTSKICVNDIMMGLKSWKDCIAVTANDSVGEDVLFDDDDDLLSIPQKAKWKGRREYEHRERRAILNYIIDNRRYHEVKGRNMWIDMEKAKVCPGRTWESMKEHFRKNIMHNLHLFKVDEKTQRKLTGPFVKGSLAVKERFLSSDSDDELLSNGEENVSRNGVKSSDSEEKENEKEEINAKGPVEERILKEDDMNILTVQGKNKGSSVKSKNKEKEKCVSEEFLEIEMTSQNDNEKNSSPKILRPDNSEEKCSESENYNSLALAEMLVETEQINEGRNNEEGISDDKDEAQISGEAQESCENSHYNSRQSDKQQHTSSGQTLPDVNSSNSGNENPESTNKSYPNGMVASGLLQNNTQAFDIVYSDEEFNVDHSGLHIPKGNKEHEKSKLLGHETLESFNDGHQVHIRKEVPLITEVSDPTDSSKDNGDVCNSSVIQVQTKSAQVFQKSDTGGKVISNHVLTRSSKIESPTASRSKTNDQILASETVAEKIGTVRSKTNSRRPKDTTSPQSLRRRHNSTPSPEKGVDDASVYGSPLSSMQDEVYKSCHDKDQHSVGETTQKEIGHSMLDGVNLNISTTSISSISSGESTIIFPLNNNKTGGKGISRTNKARDRGIDYKKSSYEVLQRERRKGRIIDSDSDSQRNEYQGESSENEVVLKRNSNIRIPRISQMSQKANPRESESDCISDSFSSGGETYSHCSHASDRNHVNGRYDRTFNPKSGCRYGEKRKNGKLKHNGTRKPYSKNEDVQILKYIIKHKGYDQLGGNLLWQDMETSKTIPGRSWHSLKERFRKRIVHCLPKYVKYGFNQSHLRRLSSRVGEIETDRGNQLKTEPTGRKKSYTRVEDYMILKFINETKRHSQIGGKLMWVLMSETVEGLQGRTWMSLKERFRRTILKNLQTYKISDEDRRKLKKSEQRHSPGIRLYFKEERQTSSDDDSSSSYSSYKSFRKRKSLSFVNSKKREDLKRGLKSRQIIDQHFGLEPKPGTSGCHYKNTTTGLVTTCSTEEVAVSKNSKKRKLYTKNSVLAPLQENTSPRRSLSENTCIPRRSSTPKMLNEESPPDPTIADNCNKNQKKNFSELEDNSNTEESQVESEEIPLLLGNPSLKSCKVSNSLNRNDAAVMNKSGISNASSPGKEKEPETLANKKSISSDREPISTEITSSTIKLLEEDSIGQNDCAQVEPLSCEMESGDTTNSQNNNTLSEIESEEESNAPSKRMHRSLSLPKPGSIEERRLFRNNSFINLRPNTIRRKLRKRHVRLLKM
ncbi:uro-adherence factor A-like [Palaemon carinicauda]|uniref:uro-adherence factor A-like n=1 Tax=Palaemon carinicauda TaxID=392227 RepID=UPI0035B67C08